MGAVDEHIDLVENVPDGRLSLRPAKKGLVGIATVAENVAAPAGAKCAHELPQPDWLGKGSPPRMDTPSRGSLEGCRRAALRQVRAWLDPWAFLWRCWRA